MAKGLEIVDLWGPLQPKPFCDWFCDIESTTFKHKQWMKYECVAELMLLQIIPRFIVNDKAFSII